MDADKLLNFLLLLLFISLPILLAFGVGCLGRNRRIGFGWAFFIALLNVIVGLIVVLCSKKKNAIEFVDINTKKKRKKNKKMKRWGWGLLIIGCLSTLGSLSKGDSPVGAIWAGLGLYLIHCANQKEKERKEMDEWENGEHNE